MLRSPSMMTAVHDMHATEAKKERYSRDLAAYTLKQWDLARRALEVARSQQPQRDKSHSPRRRAATPPGEPQQPSRGPEGVQATDYARINSVADPEKA